MAHLHYPTKPNSLTVQNAESHRLDCKLLHGKHIDGFVDVTIVSEFVGSIKG